MHEPHATARPHRFYCPTLAAASDAVVSDAAVTLDNAASHHARNVLRLSGGDPVILFDGRGTLATATIERYEGGRALCRVGVIEQVPAAAPTLTVASAVPKGPRADAMIDQLSQLGVDRFVPLRAEHSVAVPKESKLEKFRRAAVESAKQCGRTWLMSIDEPAPPDAVWSDAQHDLKLLAVPDGGVLPDLADRVRVCEHVLVSIGPEGGWSGPELASAQASRCVLWAFAPHVLRVETAAAAAAAILRNANAH
jgi:16S rRNA (uracil1498-N3)-methyltransferase